MKKQNAKTVTGSYRHFKRQPDGSLKFVGVVTYNRPEEPTYARSEADRAEELAWRDEDDIARHEADCAAFEDLVDRTCESEG